MSVATEERTDATLEQCVNADMSAQAAAHAAIQQMSRAGLRVNPTNIERGMAPHRLAEQLDKRASELLAEANKLRGQARKLRGEAYAAFTDTQPHLFEPAPDDAGDTNNDAPAFRPKVRPPRKQKGQSKPAGGKTR